MYDFLFYKLIKLTKSYILKIQKQFLKLDVS